MYTRWDGRQWTKPVDIFFAPPQEFTLVIAYPHAVIDENGRIHLIWLGEPSAPNYAIYYSSAPALAALSSHAWEPCATLSNDLTGTNYSIHIAYTSPTTLHVLYARVAAGDQPGEERAVTYMRSTDLGLNWSEPIDIYTIPFLDWGASNTRLLVDPPNTVYASWSIWNASGNGQAIFFARSLDNGLNWDEPVKLTERIEPEYERDWNNMALLGKGQIVTMWEGGYRAYRYVMYSSDGGVTWSQPSDFVPWLIGENGFVEFAFDSVGRLHLFYSQRIREGFEYRGEQSGLWHSTWIRDTLWTEPKLEGGPHAMLNPKVVIAGGNQVVAAWYTSSNNDYEIRVMTGELLDAPSLPKKSLPTVISPPFETPTTPVYSPTPTAISVFPGIT